MRHCSFDLTDFNSTVSWLNILYNCSCRSFRPVRHRATGRFIWHCKNMDITTTANPFNGAHYYLENETGLGYAGYIGASGTTDAIENFIRLVEEKAYFIKDADYWARSFV